MVCPLGNRLPSAEEQLAAGTVTLDVAEHTLVGVLYKDGDTGYHLISMQRAQE